MVFASYEGKHKKAARCFHFAFRFYPDHPYPKTLKHLLHKWSSFKQIKTGLLFWVSINTTLLLASYANTSYNMTWLNEKENPKPFRVQNSTLITRNTNNSIQHNRTADFG